MTSPSALTRAHWAADHQLAAGDTSDLLPGIDPEQASDTARRIIHSGYHADCPTCQDDPPACSVCDRVSASCRFGAPRLCSCWRGLPCA